MSRPDFHQIYSDLELRYGNTFVQYRGGPDKPFETVHLLSVIENIDDYPSFSIVGLKGRQIVSYRGNGEFNFKLPETRYFTYKGNSFVSFYRPSRQNKRSLCTSTNLRQNFYSQQRLSTHLSLDIYIADNIFNPQYMDCYSILEQLNSKSKYCIALDSSYALGLNITKNKNHLLFYYFTPIAEVNAEGVVQNVLHKSFESLVNAAPIPRF